MTAKVIDLAERRKARDTRAMAVGTILALLGAVFHASKGHPDLKAVAMRWCAEAQLLIV